MTQDTFLLCAPQHFEVNYVINPWMRPGEWHDHERTHAEEATEQWNGLHAALLDCGANLHVMDQTKGWPDMVFTANAGIVLDRKALVANFKHPERAGETPIYAAEFERLARAGIIDDVIMLPKTLAQEGAGECLWDVTRGVFWGAVGPRSERKAYDVVEEVFGRKVEVLELATPEYYHLDVCLSPLPSGHVLCFKPAFAPASFERLQLLVGDKLIEVGETDARNFVINSVHINDEFFISSPLTDGLKARLHSVGLKTIERPFNAFILAGGAACCLTLKLNRTSS